MDGHTCDLSSEGIGLIVPAIRIGEHYFVGEERRLLLKLDLPTGSVDLNISPVRYESLEDDAEESGYVIGARINDMNESDRERFNEYVKTLLKQGG